MRLQNEFIYPLRVHIDDTDYTGIVYHSNYLKFMERARSEWMDLLGFGMSWQREHEIHFVLHSINMYFLKPAHVHERVEVVTSIKTCRPASIIYDQHLRLANATDKILCKAEIKIACVDYELHPRAMPKSPNLMTLRRELT